jgi:tetratricopeptide (TPR) repeat protein
VKSDNSCYRSTPSPRLRPAARGVLLLVCAISIAALACSRHAASSKADAIRRGDELAAKHQYAQAIAAYRAAVERDPSDGHVRMKLANACLADQRWDEGLKEALRAAELLPGDFDAEMLATSRLLGSGHYLEALIRSSDLLRKHPHDVNVILLSGNATARLLNSSWALYKLPDTVRSADDFDRARAELRPDQPPSEDENAEELFREALKRAPTLLEAQLALPNFLWAAGRPDDAEPLLKSIADQQPGLAVVNYALGVFYAWRLRSDEAEPYLKNAAAAGRYGVGARFALADLYIATNRDQEALAILGPMAEADDLAGAVSLRAAPLEFRQGKREAAVRRLDRFLSREPKNAKALLLEAQFLVDQRQFGDAVKAARIAVEASPDSVEARSMLGQALFGTNELEGAFDALAEAVRLGPGVAQPQLELTRVALALGRYREAVQFAREATRHLPDNPNAVVMLAKALIRSRDLDGAERELKLFLARSPESPDLSAGLGAVHAARGNAAAARAAFGRALASNGNSVDAISGLVELDLGERNTGAARRRIEAASAAHPDDPAVLLLAARVYEADKDSGRAEATLRHLLAVHPASVEGSEALSEWLVSHRREGEAKKLLEQLIERQPRSVDAETALATLLERTGLVSDAQARYEKILGEHPRAASASYRLAALYLNKGNLERALELAMSAKRLLPDEPAVSSLLGRIYLKRSLPGQAVPHLEDAVRAAPVNAEYRYQLGSAYVGVKNFSAARGELKRALQIDQNFAQAAETRAVLASLH